MTRPAPGFLVALLSFALATTGCCQPSAVTQDSLAANNPGDHPAVTGCPPVPPESLGIVPTGMSPVSTAAVRPDPILPTMDEVYQTRRLPPGVESRPATRPSGHEGGPEDRYQPENHHQPEAGQ